MAQQVEINIKIKLTDDVTKGIKVVDNNLNKLGNSIKSVGRNIQNIGSTLTMTGALITAPLVLAFKNAEKYSFSVNKEVSRLNNTFTNFSTSIATAMIPVMQKLNNTLQGFLAIWNKLGPSTQQFIIQSVFLTGVFLTISGSVVFAIGKFLSLAGAIIKATGAMGAFIAKALGMKVALVGGIAAALVLVIALMLRFKEVGTAVMNSLEAAFKTLSIGLMGVVQAIANLIAFIYGMFEKLDSLLAKLPEKLGGEYFSDLAQQFKDAREQIDAFTRNLETAKQSTANEVISIFQEGEGQWSKWFDSVRKNITDLFDTFSKGANSSVDQLFEWGSYIEDITKQIAQSMSSALGNFFFDALTGQLKSAKEIFADFGKAILQILTQALSRVILFMTLGKALQSSLGFNPFGSFHHGGIIKAHSGYLANDEVPIIAQKGEAVLSRGAVNSLGAYNIARLNRGQGLTGSGQSIVYQPVLVIQAWDTRDVQRNSKSIEAIMASALRRNSRLLRDTSKEYG